MSQDPDADRREGGGAERADLGGLRGGGPKLCLASSCGGGGTASPRAAVRALGVAWKPSYAYRFLVRYLIYDGHKVVELGFVYGRGVPIYASHSHRLAAGVELDPGKAMGPYWGCGTGAYHQVRFEADESFVVAQLLRLPGNHLDIRTEPAHSARYNLAVVAKLIDYQNSKLVHIHAN